MKEQKRRNKRSKGDNVQKLKQENRALKAANIELHSRLIRCREEAEITDELMKELEKESAREVGCIVLKKEDRYKDLIEILLENEYAIEIGHRNRKMMVVIKERE